MNQNLAPKKQFMPPKTAPPTARPLAAWVGPCGALTKTIVVQMNDATDKTRLTAPATAMTVLPTAACQAWHLGPQPGALGAGADFKLALLFLKIDCYCILFFLFF